MERLVRPARVHDPQGAVGPIAGNMIDPLPAVPLSTSY